MTVQHEIVASRSAWLGQDLQASGEWIYRLGQEEIAELDAALRYLKASGRQIPDAGRNDFPLAHFGRTCGCSAQRSSTGSVSWSSGDCRATGTQQRRSV